MKHLILCREYPPAPIPAGGIGTYVYHIARLLASAGETVHVIGQLWSGAPKEVESLCDGRLILHRVPVGSAESMRLCRSISSERRQELSGLHISRFPPQSFAWQAGLLAEKLVEEEGIDVIEAQEYEAPLYYFQLRRSLGRGPKRTPPCFVHLHSPTQIIVQHNDADPFHPYFLTAGRLEAHSIGAADGLLCPSRYLARQAERHFGLHPDSVEVIPLPIGDNEFLDRDGETWEKGSIIYVGRMEGRKGILEWIDAAVSVAPHYPDATFDFIGANCLATERVSGTQIVESRIPRDLKPRFRFRGAQDRSMLSHYLRQACMAVVPSRWENFPNTCVEAMCSGLPVIASPEGGMAEMIRDGENGWLASGSHPEELAEALRRALNTRPEERALMGRNAAKDIRRICDNQETLGRHLEFRSRLIRQGSQRSLHLPANLPWSRQPLHGAAARCSAEAAMGEGIAVVVSCFHAAHGLRRCLWGLRGQTQKPVEVVVLVDEWTRETAGGLFQEMAGNGWRLIAREPGSWASARNLGLQAVLESGSNPLGIVFLEAEDQIEPPFLESVHSVLEHCPEVGVVSCWVEDLDYRNIANPIPCASFPFQWLNNELVTFSAVRTAALQDTGPFRTFSRPEYEIWDLFNAVMVSGWAAVTVPAVLGRERTSLKFSASPHNSVPHGRMCERILGRFPDLVARDSHELLILALSSGTYLVNAEVAALRSRLQVTEKYLRHPRAVLWKLIYRLKDKVDRKFPGRLPRLIADLEKPCSKGNVRE